MCTYHTHDTKCKFWKSSHKWHTRKHIVVLCCCMKHRVYFDFHSVISNTLQQVFSCPLSFWAGQDEWLPYCPHRPICLPCTVPSSRALKMLNSTCAQHGKRSPLLSGSSHALTGKDSKSIHCVVYPPPTPTSEKRCSKYSTWFPVLLRGFSLIFLLCH